MIRLHILRLNFGEFPSSSGLDRWPNLFSSGNSVTYSVAPSIDRRLETTCVTSSVADHHWQYSIYLVLVIGRSCHSKKGPKVEKQ